MDVHAYDLVGIQLVPQLLHLYDVGGLGPVNRKTDDLIHLQLQPRGQQFADILGSDTMNLERDELVNRQIFVSKGCDASHKALVRGRLAGLLDLRRGLARHSVAIAASSTGCGGSERSVDTRHSPDVRLGASRQTVPGAGPSDVAQTETTHNAIPTPVTQSAWVVGDEDADRLGSAAGERAAATILSWRPWPGECRRVAIRIFSSSVSARA